uniref:Uncharacterized protein n=1 Tax=Rangifer tarandus platyrhynchus TaxID=3082113 RepID=A0ACB0F6T0_RANTA|nr:unnamed protein product [Rangifer tarandus platyrhynchus]
MCQPHLPSAPSSNSGAQSPATRVAEALDWVRGAGAHQPAFCTRWSRCSSHPPAPVYGAEGGVLISGGSAWRPRSASGSGGLGLWREAESSPDACRWVCGGPGQRPDGWVWESLWEPSDGAEAETTGIQEASPEETEAGKSPCGGVGVRETGGNAWGAFQLEVPASCQEERGQWGRLPTRAPWAMRPPLQLPEPTDCSRSPVCGLCLCAAIVGKALPVQAPCTLVLLTCLLMGPRHTQAQESAQIEDAHPPPGTQPPALERPPPPTPAASSLEEAPTSSGLQPPALGSL